MKTKLSLLIVLALCRGSCYANDTPAYRRDFDEAKHYGARTKISVCVSDEHGTPVSNATVSAVLNPSWNARTYKTVSRETGTDGIAILEGTTIFPYIGGSVNKGGYYQSGYKLRFGDPRLTDNGGESSEPYYASKVKDGRWLPWNPTIPVVLREIRNPTPMYVSFAGSGKTAGSATPFPVNAEVGFDCRKNAWVAPYGIGEVADFTLRISSLPLPKEVVQEIESSTKKMEGATNTLQRAKYEMDLRRIDRTYYELVISAIDKEGGFIRKSKLTNTDFVSDYMAPTNGYSSIFRTSVEGTPYYDPPAPTDLSSTEYLIFRSRVIRDQDGEIVSANYGKIYGPLKHGIDRRNNVGSVGFECYFNPSPNNRSIEFDGKNNLFYPQYKTSNHAP